MEPETLGIALFGTGRIGNIHLKNILADPRLQLFWMVEADVERAKSAATKFRLRETVICDVKNAAKVYEDPRVACVVVCTPSRFHQPIVIAALKAHKSVFCEKPLAMTTAEVMECYCTARQYNQPLFCAFNRRYDPQVRELFNRVKRGDVGKLRMVKTTSRDPPSVVNMDYIRGSGGIFTDSAVHDIDLLMWLVGEAPTKVYATGHATDPAFAECDDVDTCSVTLNFPGGAIGHIEVSRLAPVGFDQRTEVLGTKGMIISGNNNDMVLSQHSATAVAMPPLYDDCCKRYENSYKLELEHFVDVLQGKTNLEVTEESTVTVNKVADACKLSVQTGKVIDI